MKKRFFKFISAMTIACMLGNSVEISAFAQTARTEQTEEIQQEESIEVVTVSGNGEVTDESLFRYVVDDEDNATITEYTGTDTEVIIPSTIEGHSIIRIGSEAFAYNDSLKNITIPEGVRSISEYAFGGCTSLTNITILCTV